jgi:hypothetical protein
VAIEVLQEDRKFLMATPRLDEGGSAVTAGSLVARNPVAFILHLDAGRRLRRLEVWDNNNRSAQKHMFEANFAQPARSTTGMQAPAWLSGYAHGTFGITPPRASGSSTRAGIEGTSSGNAVMPTREDASTSPATTHGPAELRREPGETANAARAQARPATTHGELRAGSSAMTTWQEPVRLSVPKTRWKTWLNESNLLSESGPLFNGNDARVGASCLH